jgi:serine/threonine protein kinase/WD40 repeat protein
MAQVIASTYEIIKELGSGGGGVVYLAEHLRLGKKVVLKADKRKITTKQELLRREVDVLKTFNHTHIPRVYDYFVDGDKVYTVMDYVEGESLDKPLKRGTHFTQAQVVKWAIQVLDALAYIHSPTHGDPPKGYVHSDIKPANLMLTPSGDIYLIDFNVALALGEENVVGKSIGYASPEHYGLDYSFGASCSDVTASIECTNQAEPEGTVGKNQNVGQRVAEQTVLEKNRETTRTLRYTQVEQESNGTIVEAYPLPKNIGGAETNVEKQDSGALVEATAVEATEIDSDRDKFKTKTDVQIEKPRKIPKSIPLTAPSPLGQSSITSGKKKVVVPDARSDIYMVGATLYHLLSGKRPAKDAREVVPLSSTEFSPLIVAIVSKAMNPNPDLRYQTAEEMLFDFTHLRDKDPRVQRQRRQKAIIIPILTLCCAFGAFLSVTGLKRMQITEQWLKLAEYSQNAMEEGDAASAVEYALSAVPQKVGIFTPSVIPAAQCALTNALSVYDLSDGYKIYETVELPSEPLYIKLSPDGKTVSCIYAFSLAIIDTESCEIVATLPVEASALSEVCYLDNDTIIYAGSTGISCYQISTMSNLWTGKPATAIQISGDGKTVVGVYKDETFATVYDAASGEVIQTVDFMGKAQKVTINDTFANPNDNLLALSYDGTQLGISFADGSLEIIDLQDSQKTVQLFDEQSGYSHFEGGFYQQYLAFSASNKDDSVFAIIDTEKLEQTGGFQSEYSFGVQTDSEGIYVQTENILVRIDPESGEQMALVNSSENIYAFATYDGHTLIATKEQLMFFDQNADLMSSYDKVQNDDFLQVAGDTAIIGGLDSPVIRVMKYENHPDAEIFTYDPSYSHDEARLSADQETVMLFSYKQFRVYQIDGELIAEVGIPNADQVYDQQYIKDDSGSVLKVTYNDGTVDIYDASSGDLLTEEQKEVPNREINDEFETDQYRIVSPLHGAPEVYDIMSGKLLFTLSEDGYLTYVTQVGEYIIAQYITADGYCFGQLLNEDCEVLAELPYLCDIDGDRLLFDYPSGNVRETRIYDINQLIEIAKEQIGGN